MMKIPSCGHDIENWYSICSGPRDPENCPRCKIGRCIICHPKSLDENNYMAFYNFDTDDKENPFPNLGPCLNPEDV